MTDKNGTSSDIVIHELFQIASVQAQNTMRLSHALRFDPGVSEETKQAARDAFDSVDELINRLNRIADVAWGVRDDD